MTASAFRTSATVKLFSRDAANGSGRCLLLPDIPLTDARRLGAQLGVLLLLGELSADSRVRQAPSCTPGQAGGSVTVSLDVLREVASWARLAVCCG
jgi:hypothetical protein